MPISTKYRLPGRAIIAIAAAVIVGASFLLRPFLFPPEVAVVRIERHDLIQTVVASGRVETPYRVNVGSQITGTVTEIPVEEGQSVTAGQVLIALDDREAKAGVFQAEDAVAEAEARLRQIRDVSLPSAREAVKQAQATLTNVQQSYDREMKLYRAGFATKADLDAAQKDLDIATTQLRSAELQVTNNLSGGSAYVMTQKQLAQARSALAAAQAKLSYTVISAPASGTLITRNVERGNVVQAGDTLMTLSPTGEVRLVLDIDEKNLGALHVGQPALASADAYPERTFPAELVYINPYVDPNQGSVTVKLTVPNPPPYLVQDMTVSVDIEVARRLNALIVPLTAVHDVQAGAPWVWRVADGKIAKRPIKLGARGDAKAELADGLAEGDLIVAAGATAITEGARVRPIVQP